LINWNATRHVLYYAAVSFLLFISRSVSLVCVAVLRCRSHEWLYACSPMASWNGLALVIKKYFLFGSFQ